MHHTTREGKTIPLAGMDDKHLLNTIRLFCRPMAALTQRLEEAPKDMSPRQRALYGKATHIPDEAYEDAVEAFYDTLGPYCVEAILRGDLEGATQAVREALGRTGQDDAAPKVNSHVHTSLQGLLSGAAPAGDCNCGGSGGPCAEFDVGCCGPLSREMQYDPNA